MCCTLLVWFSVFLYVCCLCACNMSCIMRVTTFVAFTSLFYSHTQGTLGDQDTSIDVFQTSCNLLDRFLSKKAVSGEHELVACAGAAMMISCKIRNGSYHHHHHLTSCIPCSMSLLVVSNKHHCIVNAIVYGRDSWAMNICQSVPSKDIPFVDEQNLFSSPLVCVYADKVPIIS